MHVCAAEEVLDNRINATSDRGWGPLEAKVGGKAWPDPDQVPAGFAETAEWKPKGGRSRARDTHPRTHTGTY